VLVTQCTEVPTWMLTACSPCSVVSWPASKIAQLVSFSFAIQCSFLLFNKTALVIQCTQAPTFNSVSVTSILYGTVLLLAYELVRSPRSWPSSLFALSSSLPSVQCNAPNVLGDTHGPSHAATSYSVFLHEHIQYRTLHD
jgi:hypothetical protein